MRKAIELGYRVTEIYVIWQYKISQYDASTGKGGLFTEYVNAFLQIKQQASGWPDWCESEPHKTSYLAEYERDEGIKLQREKIEKNTGLRVNDELLYVNWQNIQDAVEAFPTRT